MVYIVQWEQIRSNYKGFWNPRREVETKYSEDLEGFWPVSHVVGSWLDEMRWCFFFFFFKNVCYGRIHQSCLHDREAWNREKIPESKRDVGLSVELTLITFWNKTFVTTNLVHLYTHWMITWVIAIRCVLNTEESVV